MSPETTPRKQGIEVLYLCPRLTRAIYLEMFGEEAPAYDPKRRIQRWFVPVTPGVKIPAATPRMIDVWDAASSSIQPMEMTELEASTPNLPGALSYPKYEPSETTVAKMVGVLGDTQSVGTFFLVEKAHAAAIADEILKDLNIKCTVVSQNDPWPWRIEWGSETRRNRTLKTADGQAWDAGQLVRKRFEAGVGAPGKWVLAGGGPTFVADVPPTGELDLRPEVPMALRKLEDNERIELGFGGIPSVVRTDVIDVNEPSAKDGFRESDRETLHAIANHLGVS